MRRASGLVPTAQPTGLAVEQVASCDGRQVHLGSGPSSGRYPRRWNSVTSLTHASLGRPADEVVGAVRPQQQVGRGRVDLAGVWRASPRRSRSPAACIQWGAPCARSSSTRSLSPGPTATLPEPPGWRGPPPDVGVFSDTGRPRRRDTRPRARTGSPSTSCRRRGRPARPRPPSRPAARRARSGRRAGSSRWSGRFDDSTLPFGRLSGPRSAAAGRGAEGALEPGDMAQPAASALVRAGAPWPRTL